jgi:hypothetical protein
MINLGLVFVPYVTMPGGKGWWMLIRGIETLERGNDQSGPCFCPIRNYAGRKGLVDVDTWY